MSVNRITLIGNVGAEPDVRTLNDGTKVASVRLAVTKRAYTTKSGTQVPEKTEWFSLSFWRQQADVVQSYVHKGDKLYVEGEMQSRTYTDKNHPDVTYTAWDVNVDKLELLTPKQQPSAAPQQQFAQTPQFTYQQAMQAAAAAQQYTQQAPPMPEQTGLPF